jgi:hypothetical protein
MFVHFGLDLFLTQSCDDLTDLRQWCDNIGFPEIYEKLIGDEFKFTGSVEDLLNLWIEGERNDIHSICEKLDFGFGQTGRFITKVKESIKLRATIPQYSRVPFDNTAVTQKRSSRACNQIASKVIPSDSLPIRFNCP